MLCINRQWNGGLSGIPEHDGQEDAEHRRGGWNQRGLQGIRQVIKHSSFFHKSRLLNRDDFNKNIIYKKFRDLTKDWTQIARLAVSHSNQYIKMFSLLVWGLNWILFMHRWFCQINLIHLTLKMKISSFWKIKWNSYGFHPKINLPRKGTSVIQK